MVLLLIEMSTDSNSVEGMNAWRLNMIWTVDNGVC